MLSHPALIGGAPLYVTNEDALKLTGWNSATGVVLTLSGRFLPIPDSPSDPPPRVQPFEHTLTPTTDRVATTTTKPLGEGWILDWSIRVSSGTPIVGQTFARLELARGLTSVATVLARIAAGYVTGLRTLGNGINSVGGPCDGAGALRSITGTDPAAGLEVSETVPTGARWRLHALRVTLVTDGTATTRTPGVFLDDGANVYAASGDTSGSTATTTIAYNYGQYGYSNAPTSPTHVIGEPMLIALLAGHRIRTSTVNIQAGDNYGAPQLLVEEWLEG